MANKAIHLAKEPVESQYILLKHRLYLSYELSKKDRDKFLNELFIAVWCKEDIIPSKYIFTVRLLISGTCLLSLAEAYPEYDTCKNPIWLPLLITNSHWQLFHMK